MKASRTANTPDHQPRPSAPEAKLWTPQYPELSTKPLSTEPYLSPQWFERDKELIFRKVWLHMGRAEELVNPGDFAVKELPLFNTSILLVRGKDHVIRGFHNVCRHRGNRVVELRQGNQPTCKFTCRFHGFTYDSEGKLVGLPEESKFLGLDKAEHGLTPIATDVWEGFVFINMDPEPKETLKEYMCGYVEQLKGLPFDQLPVCYSYETDINCNWRILRDSQLEMYHIKTLHKLSVPDYIENLRDPDSHTHHVELGKRHGMASWFLNPEIAMRPVEALALQADRTKIINGPLERASGSWSTETPLYQPPLVNPTRTKDWFLDYIFIFPNFHLLPFEGLYITHHMWPVAPGRSHWEARIYLPRAKNASQVFAREYSRIQAREVWLEDGSTLEHMQQALESGVLKEYLLQDQEILIRHANRVCEDYLRRVL
jgi:phenylpropionate dioxygenase-like ring-hydroxylating dioxygenase large terminal subunit